MIYEFSSFQDVSTFMEKRSFCPDETLIGIDLDFTVFQPADHTLDPGVIKKYENQIELLINQFPPLAWDIGDTLISLYDYELVEPDIPHILNQLSDKSYPMMGITARMAGILTTPEGFSADINDSSHEALLKFGIEFKTAPQIPETIFTEIAIYGNAHPTYRHGILVTNGELGGHTKGSVFCCFLDKLPTLPKTIIVVDDKMKNLTAIEYSLQKLHPEIQYIGIYYTGAYQAPPPDVEYSLVHSKLEALYKHAQTQRGT